MAIEIRGIDKSFGARRVLRRVTMMLADGATYCLMAPSGSGKTTLLRTIMGLERPDAGEIVGLGPGDVAVVFQEERLCEALTPVENVALVLGAGARRSEVREALGEILPMSCLDQPVSELSGGMRRRVSLARAVLFPSKLLLLDEPFSGLDVATKEAVADFLLDRQGGRTMLVSTHNEADVELLRGTKVTLAEVSEG